MANRHLLDGILDALDACEQRRKGRKPVVERLRFEQELEEVAQLADRIDAAHFRDRIDNILDSRKH
ncbi:MAG TPA: hypothetical protein VGC74_08550 [Stenotrophomonas sp.]|jgi:hypothetical protein